MADLNLFLHFCYWMAGKICLTFGCRVVGRLLHSYTIGSDSEISISVLYLSCRVILIPSLLQNTSVVSAGKVSLVLARQVDTIYTIRKGCLFSIGCIKTTDTNKCPVWPISKALLVSAGLNQPTPLSPVQIENII
jgi:hypothetical protein